ncbi:glycoside hydrolase family 2 protein [Paenibacillus sp. TAB 01]|uniref:glycoside hydrolase family 2 protein n=1 Tax=Paenibacillus sp. TAB 01 TaxID=3368988 RepID=UPI003751461C
MRNQEILSLDGDWKLAAYEYVADRKDVQPDTETLDWMDAAVPGAVHYDLVKSGKLENPFASTQAAHAAEWVAQTDWIYTREFELEQELSDGAAFALRIDGIDTYADIWLNDRLLGQTANAYRSYEFEVDASMLRAGENRLIVHVKNHFRMTEGKADEAKRRLQVSRNPTAYRGKSLIRRYQRNFYSNSSLLNLGTGVLGIGIHKPVRLIAYPKLRIEESYFSVQQLTASQADVRVEVKLNRPLSEIGQALTIEAVLQQPDMRQPAAVHSAAVTGGETDLRLTMQEPRLWWPRGYGGQPLYRLTLRLYDGTTLLHEIEKQVGIKQVEVIRELPNGRKTFYLQVNGVKIHARGSNLIPVDYLKVHDTWDVYERLFRLMQASHHNTLRIWGGGAVETDKFYDRCDELGILIWQDFFLHSNTYPDYDPEFVEEFRQESVELVKRIRAVPAWEFCAAATSRWKAGTNGTGRPTWTGSTANRSSKSCFLRLRPPIAPIFHMSSTRRTEANGLNPPLRAICITGAISIMRRRIRSS